MGKSRWTPPKGREMEGLTDKLNELIDAVNKQSKGKADKQQNITAVPTDNGYALQIRTKDGIIQSDPTYATGFKKI